MVRQLSLGVIILAVFAVTDANPDIQVLCGKHSVRIVWRIGPEMMPYIARLFLGNCLRSQVDVLPNGGADVQFNYPLADCKFKKQMKGKRLIYRNELSFRPQPKSKPAAYTFPIECVYKRPEGWVPPFLNPGSSVSAGRGGLVFHMALLNEQLTHPAETNVIPLGSFIPIWAAVEQTFHQPLLLLMEECVAAKTPELQPDSQVFHIIGNKGCLFDSVNGNSVFLPRYHSSALTLYLQSFAFGLGEEVYIHCNLVAWDPTRLDETKKACQYSKQSGLWELLDDPFQSNLCSCCSSTCRSRPKRGIEQESQGFSQHSVLGPLIIVDQSDSRKIAEGSVIAADSKASVEITAELGLPSPSWMSLEHLPREAP
ncbi:zona pellucida sperm-binding protein 3-like [Aulostomus maculatus]